MKALLDILSKRGWQGHLASLLSGTLLTLSLAPFDLWFLGIIAIALFGLAHQNLQPGEAWVRGWFFGAGLFGSGASWVYVSIHTHGNAPLPLALLLTTVFCGGLALCISLVSYLYVRYFRDISLAGQQIGLLVALPALWVLGEWFRCWFLTGFPWLFLGYSQVEAPLSGWAPIIGTLGISWILAFSGSSLAQLSIASLAKSQQAQISLKPQITAVLVAALLWILSPALAQINWVSPATDDKLSVALIQANIPQEEKWLSEQLRPTLDLYRQMSEKAWGKDLIVWPETAIPRLYHRANAYLSYMDAEAKKQHSAIITGIPYKQPDTGSYHNSIIAIGEGSGIYHKQRLVPFGEYIPMEKWLRGLIEFFDLPMSNFSLAPDAQALLKVGKLQLAPFICYEIVYPDLVAATVPKADLLITISNDTWFGKSHGPLQHFQMAQMRALENGRYLIRGTNNGVSALINEKGQVINRADQFVRTTVYGEVQAMSGLTPFARGGTRPVVIFCFAVLALLLGLKHLRRQHQGQN